MDDNYADSVIVTAAPTLVVSQPRGFSSVSPSVMISPELYGSCTPVQLQYFVVTLLNSQMFLFLLLIMGLLPYQPAVYKAAANLSQQC